MRGLPRPAPNHAHEPDATEQVPPVFIAGVHPAMHELAVALGLYMAVLVGFELRAFAHEAVQVTATMLASEGQARRLAPIIRKHRLVVDKEG